MRPGGLQSVRQNEQKHPSASVASESGFSSCFRTVPAGARECGLTPHLCVPEGLSDPSIFAASSCRPARCFVASNELGAMRSSPRQPGRLPAGR